MANRAYSAADHYKIAKNQRRLLFVILCSIVLYIALFVLASMNSTSSEDGTTIRVNDGNGMVLGIAFLTIGLCFIVLAVLWISTLIYLLIALRTPVLLIILVVIGAFLPVISLLVLLIVSSRATSALKSAGYKVGLIGVSRATLAQLKALSEQGTPPLPATR